MRLLARSNQELPTSPPPPPLQPTQTVQSAFRKHSHDKDQNREIWDSYLSPAGSQKKTRQSLCFHSHSMRMRNTARTAVKPRQFVAQYLTPCQPRR